MTTSERVRRGFFRVGLVGMLAALIFVIWQLSISAGWRSASSLPVHFQGQTWNIPVNSTDEELTTEIRKRDERLSYSDRIFNESELGMPMAQRIVSLRGWMRLEQMWQIDRAETRAALTLTIGAAWFLGCWLIGWVVRGFLA